MIVAIDTIICKEFAMSTRCAQELFS